MRPVYLIAHFALVNVSSALVVIMGIFTVALIAHAPHVKNPVKKAINATKKAKKDESTMHCASNAFESALEIM